MLAGGLLLTNDQVPEDFQSNLLTVTLSSDECQFWLRTALGLEDLVDHVKYRLALLVNSLDVGKVDSALTGTVDLGCLEPADEATTPERTAIAFDNIESELASGTERREILVLEQGGDLLANLNDENISGWCIFRLLLPCSAQVYCRQAQRECSRVAGWGLSGIPRSEV